MLTTFALLGLSVALIYSATWGGESGLPTDDTVYKQVIYAAIGLAVMIVAIVVDYRLLGSIAWLLYVVCLGLLGLVLILGDENYGAQRWLNLGFFPLQPSEIAKVAIIIVLARFFARHEGEMGQFRHVLSSLLIIAPPAALILLQPHLGTTVLIGVVWFGMIVVAGLRLVHLLILALAGAAASPVIWFFVLSDYHKDRLALFLNPGGADPLDAGYNVRQALISIGSGGLTGRGYMSGSQTQLHYLRVRHTDFIFSVLAEELGFIGACLLLGIFLFLVWRALRVAALSRDPFGRYLAVGIVTYIAFQTFINIGMNVQLIPVVGMPLPFVSAGGSSLITALACIGLLQSIVMRHKRLEF